MTTNLRDQGRHRPGLMLAMVGVSPRSLITECGKVIDHERALDIEKPGPVPPGSGFRPLTKGGPDKPAYCFSDLDPTRGPNYVYPRPNELDKETLARD